MKKWTVKTKKVNRKVSKHVRKKLIHITIGI